MRGSKDEEDTTLGLPENVGGLQESPSLAAAHTCATPQTGTTPGISWCHPNPRPERHRCRSRLAPWYGTGRGDGGRGRRYLATSRESGGHLRGGKSPPFGFPTGRRQCSTVINSAWWTHGDSGRWRSTANGVTSTVRAVPRQEHLRPYANSACYSARQILPTCHRRCCARPSCFAAGATGSCATCERRTVHCCRCRTSALPCATRRRDLPRRGPTIGTRRCSRRPP